VGDIFLGGLSSSSNKKKGRKEPGAKGDNFKSSVTFSDSGLENADHGQGENLG